MYREKLLSFYEEILIILLVSNGGFKLEILLNSSEVTILCSCYIHNFMAIKKK